MKYSIEEEKGLFYRVRITVFIFFPNRFFFVQFEYFDRVNFVECCFDNTKFSWDYQIEILFTTLSNLL